MTAEGDGDLGKVNQDVNVDIVNPPGIRREIDRMANEHDEMVMSPREDGDEADKEPNNEENMNENDKQDSQDS